MLSATPFGCVHHLLTVPVVVADERETRFVLDTGIGLTLLSEQLAATIGCEPNGSTYRGRRMSGQEVSVPLGSLGALSLGAARQEALAVGIST